MEGRKVDHSAVTMSQLILPHQAGPHKAGDIGYAHGGEIMKLMDTAAGVTAVRHSHRTVVTARVEDINFFHHWLEPAVTLPGGGHGGGEHGAEAAHSVGLEWALIAVAVMVAAFGLWLALSIYRQEGRAEAIAKRSGPIYTLLRNLYWVDELYDAAVIKPFYTLSRWFTAFDRWVVDGLVNASGITADMTGQIIKLFQTGLVRNYALMFLLGVIAILFYLITV